MENILILVDSVGRMVVGKCNKKSSSASILAVENPAVVNIQADQNTGQISVQLTKSNVVFSDDAQLDDRIVEQYKQIASGQSLQPQAQAVQPQAVAQQPAEEPEVIKLFDDE